MNLTGTCRKCGKTIEFRKNRKPSDDTDKWRTWEQWRTEFTTFEGEEDTGTCEGQWGGHRPVEWCCWNKGSGDPCHKRIKAEDIAGEFYACGVHMKNEIAQHKKDQDRREAEERKQEARALAEWEGEIYLKAFDNIRAAFPDMEFRLTKDGHGYRSDDRKGFRENVTEKERWGEGVLTVRKYVMVDMLALQDALSALLERTARELTAEQPHPS